MATSKGVKKKQAPEAPESLHKIKVEQHKKLMDLTKELLIKKGYVVVEETGKLKKRPDQRHHVILVDGNDVQVARWKDAFFAKCLHCTSYWSPERIHVVQGKVCTGIPHRRNTFEYVHEQKQRCAQRRLPEKLHTQP